MKYTSNVVTFPQEVVDAYMDALIATTDPILKEEDVPADVLMELLISATAACRKSVVVKHLKSIEEAGLFKGVQCLDYPGFVWTLGLMRLYAIHAFSLCLLKTLAEDLASGRRTLDDFIGYLEICQKIELEAAVHVILKETTEASRRRLEGSVATITQANSKFMLGMTVDNQLRLFRNIKDNKEMDVDDGALANFDDDMALLMPEPILDI